MDVRWASAAFMIQVLMVKINGNKMSGMMSFLDNMTKSMYYYSYLCINPCINLFPT